MLKFFLDHFDSEMLGKRAFKLEASGRLTLGAVRRLEQKQAPEFVCAIVPFSRPIIRCMEAWGATLVSIRETYLYRGGKPGRATRSKAGFSIARHELDDAVLPARAQRALAKTFLTAGRFGQDEKISHRVAEKIYTVWISNSLYRGYADAVWLAKFRGEPAGLITLKRRGQRAVVDLLAVRPEFQGRGIGQTLMLAALEYARHQKIEFAVVVEGENIPARKFYQKMGFVIEDIKLAYHKHYEN